MPLESTADRRVSPDHVVHLFDSAESVAAAVAPFVQEGLRSGDAVLLVITGEHWSLVAARLRDDGTAVDRAQACGQLTVRDAADTLRLFMHQERLRRPLFTATVGRLAEQLTSRGQRLRIYGEMVDLLAAEGDYRGAQELEDLWNEFARRKTFTLLCGYSAAHFGHPHTAEALRRICRAHGEVRSSAQDVLGAFLLSTHGAAASHVAIP